MTEDATARPGGNYTAPAFDDDLHRFRGHVAYVGWRTLGWYETESEAAHVVREACKQRGPIVEVGLLESSKEAR